MDERDDDRSAEAPCRVQVSATSGAGSARVTSAARVHEAGQNAGATARSREQRQLLTFEIGKVKEKEEKKIRHFSFSGGLSQVLGRF